MRCPFQVSGRELARPTSRVGWSHKDVVVAVDGVVEPTLPVTGAGEGAGEAEAEDGLGAIEGATRT
jgi:hypothetical protein